MYSLTFKKAKADFTIQEVKEHQTFGKTFFHLIISYMKIVGVLVGSLDKLTYLDK